MVFSGGVWGAQTLFNPTQSHAAEGATQSWSGDHTPSDSPPLLRTMSRSPRGAALAGLTAALRPWLPQPLFVQPQPLLSSQLVSPVPHFLFWHLLLFLH